MISESSKLAEVVKFAIGGQFFGELCTKTFGLKFEKWYASMIRDMDNPAFSEDFIVAANEVLKSSKIE